VLCPPRLPARHHRLHPGGLLGDHPDQPTVSPGVRREYYHEPGAPVATCVVPCAFVAVRDIAIGDISALPIRPAMRIRIAHALTPGRPRHID
jgi:hypothetical protein